MDDFDPRIEAALDTYPVVSTPAGFTRQVMAQIEREPRMHSQIVQYRGKPTGFRLDFLDLVIPGLLAFFFTLAFVLVFFISGSLDPLLVIEIRYSLQELFWQLQVWQAMNSQLAEIVPYLVALASGLFGLGILILGLVVSACYKPRVEFEIV